MIKTCVFILLAGFVNSMFAQTKSDVFNDGTEVTWLGLDFTGAKLIGDREKLGSESDIHRLLDAINDLMIKEADKYNVAAAIKRKTIANNVDIVHEHNTELDVLSMISNDGRDHLHLNVDDVQGIINSYDFKGKTGIGLIFNVESLNKLIDEGSFWITFVNMETKTILFTERITAPPSGFGLRNFWAGAVAGVLAKMKKKEFENWRLKHG